MPHAYHSRNLAFNMNAKTEVMPLWVVTKLTICGTCSKLSKHFTFNESVPYHLVVKLTLVDAYPTSFQDGTL